MFASISPADLGPARTYQLLVSTVQPRPIALVSTLSATGTENLAPFSFFMVGGANPPSLIFSPALNANGEKKDSLRNVEETQEFVVNLVTRDMALAMNEASFELAADEGEWEVAGFTPIESDLVKPRRVQESPVQFECRLFKVVQHGAGPTSANYVIGEILRFHLLASIWSGEAIIPGAFRPISRMGGPHYLDTSGMEMFYMERPSRK